MPRKARLDIPGALHHIMVRGINRSPIFLDDQDRQRFLDRLGNEVMRGKCFIYAWALMENHVHILFKSGQHGISTVMRRLLTWYAQYFNRRHGRTGHLFENRYKSILCDEDSYLLALVRYIHLNPVRTGSVSSLAELNRYSWSGHSAIIGKKGYSWMSPDYVLSQFGRKRHAARQGYLRYVEEGIPLGRIPELTGGGLVRSLGGWSRVIALRKEGQGEESDERILGGGDFVEGVLREVEARQLRQLKVRRKGITVGDIMREECDRAGVNVGGVIQGGRRKSVSGVRARIAYRCMEEIGLSAAEVARRLGVTTSTIIRAAEKVNCQGMKE
jgi:REP element-mobilizing transposase RayT